jgi:hypothetical protein
VLLEGLRSVDIKQKVIATDYENYAVLYGCQNLNFGKYETFATLLSREETLSSQYADIIEKTLSEYDYQIDSEWINPGKKCGFEMKKSSKQKIVAELNTEPHWDHYGEFTDHSQNVKSYLFEDNEVHPSGFIHGPLSFGSKSVETPLMD